MWFSFARWTLYLALLGDGNCESHYSNARNDIAMRNHCYRGCVLIRCKSDEGFSPYLWHPTFHHERGIDFTHHCQLEYKRCWLQRVILPDTFNHSIVSCLFGTRCTHFTACHRYHQIRFRTIAYRACTIQPARTFGDNKQRQRHSCVFHLYSD